MRKLLVLPLAILLLVSFSFAYELTIDSTTDSSVTLAFSNLETLDVKFTDVTATAETETSAGAYIVDTSLSSTSNSVLLTVDISPLNEDNLQIKSILISGLIESNGVKEEFSKRISLRPESTPNRSLAPELSSSEMIYWVTGLVVLLVVMVILFIFLREPKEIVIPKKVRRKSKKKVKKKKAKKKRL
ncbi:hypothetical protein J4467_03545 [Candidatus Woesearchaeota archaeon]|nr:hypothetical protein [Candidatus Woesearchaeota archaeon]